MQPEESTMHAAPAADEEAQNILAILPPSLVEEILLNTGVSDVITCGCVSAQFRAIALSETLWHRLAHKSWGGVTEPRRWLVDSPYGHFELVKRRLEYPGTYRSLYPILREYARLVGGIWLDPDRNKMCVFNWRPDSVEGTEFGFDGMAGPPVSTAFQRMSADGVSSVHFVNDENCWVKEYKVQAGRLVRPPNQKAQAAANVAMGRCSADGGEELGSSPQGSFEYEMLRFMQASISGKRRKSRSKSPLHCSHSNSEIVAQFHLRRIPLQAPTRAHPLNGLWKGDFRGRQGVQVITVLYDFSQRYAVVKAYKVESGFSSYTRQPLWMASAQASSPPLSAKDSDLIANRPHFLEAPAPQPQLASASDAAAAAQQDPLLKEVVASYRGRGRFANSMDWCEGRLWQYADGDIGFLWLVPEVAAEGVLVDFKRIDHEIPT